MLKKIITIIFLILSLFILINNFSISIKNKIENNKFSENEIYFIKQNDTVEVSNSLRSSLNRTQSTWIEITGGSPPGKRYAHKMAYDNNGNCFYLFGGYDDTNYLGDLWKYDLILNKWSEITDINPPHARAPDGLVYDPANDVLYMYGGFYWENSLGYRLTDLWKYDINNYIWNKLNDGSAIVNRSASEIVFDADQGEIYMFGGFSENVAGNHHGDLWKYDISGNSWNVINVDPSPENRSSFGMTFNKKNSNIYLYGGNAYSKQLDDLWCFNTTTQKWYEIVDENSFGIRSSFSMLYREVDNELFMFGGGDAVLKQNDLWRFCFSNNTWFEVECQNKPERRVDQDIIYDEEYDQFLLFGGDPNYGDLWKFEFNKPPYLISDIPDDYYLEEDNLITGDNLIDLELYFNDDNDDGRLRFELVYEQDSNILDGLIDGHYIDFIQMIPHWSGTLEFQVKAIDSGGDREINNFDDKFNLSNVFKVKVIPINDRPMINDIDGVEVKNNYVELDLIEDTWFNAKINITEVDDDDVLFYSNLTYSNFKLDVNDGTISFLPRNENVGKVYCNITVDDGNGSKNFTNIIFNVQNENDPPFNLKINLPSHNSEWKTSDLIDFIGSCDDPDLHIPDSDETLAYEWSSNIDNKFGTNLETHNVQLSKGKHTIILKVTDKAGESVSTSIEIYIEEGGPTIVVSPPFVELLSPIDNKIINTTSIQLSWRTNFSLAAYLTYDIYIDTNQTPVKLRSSKQIGRDLIIDDLADGITYYWTVIPYYGNLKGNCTSGIFSFSVEKEFEEYFDFDIKVPERIIIYPGDKKTETIQITNLGTNVDSIRLTLNPAGLENITLLSQIHINKSETKNVILEIILSDFVEPDNYLIKITGKSEGGLEKEFTINLIVLEPEIETNETETQDSNMMMLLIFILIIIIIVTFFLLLIFVKRRQLREKQIFAASEEKQAQKKISILLPIETQPEISEHMNIQQQEQVFQLSPDQVHAEKDSAYEIKSTTQYPQLMPMQQDQKSIPEINDELEKTCPTCRQQITSISTNNIYYCPYCKKYI